MKNFNFCAVSPGLANSVEIIKIAIKLIKKLNKNLVNSQKCKLY